MKIGKMNWVLFVLFAPCKRNNGQTKTKCNEKWITSQKSPNIGLQS